jgi:hypothetical protein
MTKFLIKGFEIDRSMLKKLLTHSDISQVYSSTALSPEETVATWIIKKLGILEGTNYGYIGNVGIKSYIPEDLKLFVNRSHDLDIALENIEGIPKEYKIIKDRLIDKVKYGHYRMEITYSVFSVYRIPIPTFQIDSIEYRIIDAFTTETGIGPIQLKKEDFRKIKYIGYLPVLPLEVLIPSHINPKSFTYERARRALFAAATNYIDIHYAQQKLEESKEIMDRLGIGYQYKKELKKVSKECFRVERKVTELISRYYKSDTDNESVENARKICELLRKLY